MGDLFRIKLIVVGDTCKSCLLNNYLYGKFSELHDVTVGVDFGSKELTLRGKSIKAMIWDTAGQEAFRSLTRSYYQNVAGALIVFDICQRGSFDKVESWLRDIRASRSEQMSIVIVGNKSDLDSRRAVSQETAQQYAAQRGCKYVESSAKTGRNVTQAFEGLLGQILDRVEAEPRAEICGLQRTAMDAAAAVSVTPARRPKGGGGCCG